MILINLKIYNKDKYKLPQKLTKHYNGYNKTIKALLDCKLFFKNQKKKYKLSKILQIIH